MLIVTSIPPNSINSQEAVKTWHKHGQVYSLNSETEIDKINTKDYPNVIFTYTHRVILWNGRPLVNINALIDVAIEEDDDLFLINSDIIIDHLPEFKDDGITIFTRCDYENEETKGNDGRLYAHGFDAFYIPHHLLKIYPPTIYCLGCCHFDYSIPYRYLTNAIPVYWPQGKYIFHKTHPFAWNYEEWLITAKFFKMEFKIQEQIDLGVMSDFILKEIQVRSIK